MTPERAILVLTTLVPQSQKVAHQNGPRPERRTQRHETLRRIAQVRLAPNSGRHRTERPALAASRKVRVS